LIVVLKVSMLSICLILLGRLFQRNGADAAKALSPKVLSLVLGVFSRRCSFERSDRGVEYGSHSSVIYRDADQFKARYVIITILKIIRCYIGCQCKPLSTGVIWSILQLKGILPMYRN